uniref:MICOS complex subunit MIC19 n=1 Tax=Plectus sambesii TaxID=2011161 RepID=A0A914XFH1_9BILA
MGHNQSSEETSDTVRIDKTAVPDAFEAVHVSDSVVDRVGTARRRTGTASSDGDAQKWQDALQREREANENLRREVLNLRNSGASRPASSEYVSSDRREVEDERRRTFQETIDRVSQRFFSNVSESACAANAQQVIQCYTDNLKQPLNCSHLSKQFQQCVADYRTDMLARNA